MTETSSSRRDRRRSGWIAGLNHGAHDASCALLHDGELVVAVEQERLSRRKRAAGEAPVDALKCCLDFADLRLSDLDAVALGSDHDALARWLGLTPEQRHAVLPFDHPDRLFPAHVFGHGTRPRLIAVKHHRAHAASAFWPSGFETAAILVMDAMGEDSATTLAQGGRAGIRDIQSYPVDTSLGFFYESATEYTGLDRNDAGKLMGLAAYGRTAHNTGLRHGPGGIEWPIPSSNGHRGRKLIEERCERLLDLFEQRCFPFLRGQREEIMAYADFAASVQHDLGRVILGLVGELRARTDARDLVLAGGVALNCTANGLLAASGIFERVFVQPMAHDAGVALGAALEVSRALLGERFQPREMTHAQWGPDTRDEQVEAELGGRGLEFTRFDKAGVAREVARLLAAGRLVAWHQGRAEVGPRALGARSLLGDPRSRRTLVRMNRTKGREMWRPLAPSVLADRFHDYFIGTPNPFMIMAAQVRAEARRQIPAVVHVDGSARPQVVDAACSPLYARLLEEFDAQAGVPVLVNSSLNLAGQPIVSTPADTIECFLRSDIDALAIGPCLVVKECGAHPRQQPDQTIAALGGTSA
jgi:carbamoyltransferase